MSLRAAPARSCTFRCTLRGAGVEGSYMYEYAETKGAYRHTLPQIRAGEYEKVAERIVTKEWEPDFGPAEFIPRWGATVCGARKLLIAFNINVLVGCAAGVRGRARSSRRTGWR